MTNTNKQVSEVTLYYAEVATDKVSPNGEIIYSEYLFKSEDEAIKSGTDYHIATWDVINSFADYYTEFVPNKIIVTPQGKFIWKEIYEEVDWNDELEITKCVYRPYGAPDDFCEEIEEYLTINHNNGAELILVECEEREGRMIHTATISSNMDGVFAINTLGEFRHV